MKQGLSNKSNITGGSQAFWKWVHNPPGGSLEHLQEEDAFPPLEFLSCQPDRNTTNAAATAKGPQEHQQKWAMGSRFLGTCQNHVGDSRQGEI